MTGWTAAQMPDQSGRTVIVTGANSGIGLEAARELARHGARVVLACRNIEKADRAAAEIEGETEVRELDLAHLGSVRAFADAWDGPIDVLVNNAGLMAVPESRTRDGFEMQVGTNHLGHFALTGLLLEQITDRVVTLSSFAHKIGSIDLADLSWERRRYSRWRAYGQSKLANLIFALELQRRLESSGSSLRSVAAHPGYAATNLQSHTESIQDRIMETLNKLIAQDPDDGALPTLFAATQDIPGGSYIGPGRPGGARGAPTFAGNSKAARDERTGAALWHLSEELTGVEFPLGTAASTASA